MTYERMKALNFGTVIFRQTNAKNEWIFNNIPKISMTLSNFDGADSHLGIAIRLLTLDI